MHWFNYHWYVYLFKDCEDLTQLWCRMRGHPAGVVWFNIGGDEPDMQCKNCGEDLG